MSIQNYGSQLAKLFKSTGFPLYPEWERSLTYELANEAARVANVSVNSPFAQALQEVSFEAFQLARNLLAQEAQPPAEPQKPLEAQPPAEPVPQPSQEVPPPAPAQPGQTGAPSLMPPPSEQRL